MIAMVKWWRHHKVQKFEKIYVTLKSCLIWTKKDILILFW